jgi:predicted nucleic acid-binding protein
VSGVFVDTSALLPLLNPRDGWHDRAHRSFRELQTRDGRLLTTSYVLIEAYALLARRLGMVAVREFRSGFTPLLEVKWVDEVLHEEALDLLIQRNRRGLSLVDAASFVVMRRHGIAEAFAYDRHFEDEGFKLV